MKTKELKDLSLSDLNQKLDSSRKELVELKLKHSGHQLKNPIKIREVRRDIARINTIIAEKKRSEVDERSA